MPNQGMSLYKKITLNFYEWKIQVKNKVNFFLEQLLYVLGATEVLWQELRIIL